MLCAGYDTSLRGSPARCGNTLEKLRASSERGIHNLRLPLSTIDQDVLTKMQCLGSAEKLPGRVVVKRELGGYRARLGKPCPDTNLPNSNSLPKREFGKVKTFSS